MFKGISLL